MTTDRTSQTSHVANSRVAGWFNSANDSDSFAFR